MASQNDTKAGCFSGFRLRNVFGRKRERAVNTFVPRPVPSACCDGEWSFAPAEPLPPYTPSSLAFREKHPSTLSPEVIESIESKLNELDSELRELSLKIHEHPELAFKEHYAHDTLTSFMESHGFTVTRHYTNLPTAWRAEYASTACAVAASKSKYIPVLGVNSEMDALPGIGHGCGHNLIAICGVGIALAVRYALEKHGVAGKIILLGTPAEEGGGGKAILLKKDAYKDMDVCVMSHPMPGPTNSAALIGSNAAKCVTVEYFGKTAHAGAQPWEGKNALDAGVIAYSAISALRQQFLPTVRVHGIIEGKDWAANVIPDYAKLTYIIRAPTLAEMNDTYKRVEGCFQAAALASGCEVKINEEFTYYDLRQNSVLSDEFAANAHSRYNTQILPAGLTGASTDFGNVSYELPGLHPGFSIPTEENGANHTIGFTRSAKTPEAHTATMIVTKALALTGFRALADEEFLKQVKDSFEEEKGLRQTVYERV